MDPAVPVGAEYGLGYAAAEQRRLTRHAARLAPLTERFFQNAGVGTAQRVLEIGFGMGDVAQIAARLVAPAGNVVGVERDAPSAGMLANEPDAVVGGFVLNHSRDASGLLRALPAPRLHLEFS